MTDRRTPLEIIDQFAKQVERHPEFPLTPAERETIQRVSVAFQRLDAVLWFFGWSKWAVAVVVAIWTQWDRIAAALDAWRAGQ